MEMIHPLWAHADSTFGLIDRMRCGDSLLMGPFVVRCEPRIFYFYVDGAMIHKNITALKAARWLDDQLDKMNVKLLR